MLVDDSGNIYLEIEDHQSICKILLKKFQEEGIKFDESIIFPVTLESSWLINALLMMEDADAVQDLVRQRVPLAGILD